MYSSYDAIRTLTQTFARDTAYVLFYRRIEADSGKSQRSRSSLTEDVIPPTSSLRLTVEEDNKVYREVSEIVFMKSWASRLHLGASLTKQYAFGAGLRQWVSVARMLTWWKVIVPAPLGPKSGYFLQI